MRGPITWFVDNPIASKLMMILIILLGVLSFPSLDKEFFPQIKMDLIRVSVVYPGAGPMQVEQQICARVEESVRQLAGIEEIRSIAREGVGEVIIEVEPGGDTQRLLNDVEASVNAINTFPVESERPQIVELRWTNTFMRLQLAGDIGERALKGLGQEIRQELAALPSVALVELHTPRKYELAIELSEWELRRHDLSFSEVAAAVRSYSFNLPAGKLRADDGDISLQIRAQADVVSEFEKIPVRHHDDGSRLRVSDVAEVVDGFEEVDVYSALNGRPSLELWVKNQSRPNILRASREVKEYIEKKSRSLPDAVELTLWSDASNAYRGRLDTLIYNGSGGLFLVFSVLLVFLRPGLALWVCSGIAVAFLGAIWALSLTSVSLNVISMFAFIMILGIVVDDAIIVGESIHDRQSVLRDKRRGAIEGCLSVITPVWFAVLSTMIFFVPFFYLGEGPEPATLATPVMFALIFSLLEALLLLPSHLASTSAGSPFKAQIVTPESPLSQCLARLERHRLAIADSLPRFARGRYRRFLLWTMAHRRAVLVAFVFLFLFAVATVRSGWVPFSFFPRVTSDFINAEAVLPDSASFAQVTAAMRQMEFSAEGLKAQINRQYGYSLIRGIHASADDTTARVTLLLEDGNDRPISSDDLARQWRRQNGMMPGVKSLNFGFTIIELPKPIEFILRSDSQSQLEEVSRAMVIAMRSIEGVHSVGSTLEEASNEIDFKLRPEAENLSLSLREISLQLRQAFYGEEVQRIPRLREDVKVLVRYSATEREKYESLNEMRVMSVDGFRVPLTSLVDVEYIEGYKKIERLDSARVARVSADVQFGYSATEIITLIESKYHSEWQRSYPGVTISLEGEQRENDDFLRDLIKLAAVALLGIFALMAVMFRSYWQPFLILSAVPFGFMGAILGHVIIGVHLSMFSILGIMACAGVVVNDNVVLIDRVNKLRRDGLSARRAVVEAAVQRFRPIVLTSATTFLGLTPILLESSVQAQFLIPMVASLSFGVLCATLVTLLFVPLLYLAGERLRYIIARLYEPNLI